MELQAVTASAALGITRIVIAFFMLGLYLTARRDPCTGYWTISSVLAGIGSGTPVYGAVGAFGIWFASKGRIAHTGLLERRDGDWLITIEANTSPTAAVGSAADRDGQGVYRKRRHWRTVHSTRDWLAGLE